MRPLAEHLSASGFPVRAVRLAGHGTSVADLAATGWRDWVSSAEVALAGFHAEVRFVAAIGLSLGGLVALRLAAMSGTAVSALVLCAPAMTLADWRPRLLPWIHRLPTLRRRIALLPKRGGRDIADPEARHRSEAYDAIPLPALLELLELQGLVRRDTPRVTQPALLLHGRHDHTVPLRSQERLRRALAGRWVETRVLERSWHVLTEDIERDEVGRMVADFLARVEHAALGRRAPA